MASVKKMAVIIIQKEMNKRYDSFSTAIENKNVEMAKKGFKELEEAYTHLKSVEKLPNHELGEGAEVSKLVEESDALFEKAKIKLQNLILNETT